MDTDIRDELDASFGDGPPASADLAQLIGQGRTTLRRRRLLEAGSTLAVAVVAVGAAALVSGGTGDDHASPAPAAPSPSARVDPSSTATLPPTRPGEDGGRAPGVPVVRDDGLPLDWPLAAQPDGLHVAEGVRLLRVVDDPWGVRSDGTWSVAVSYRVPHREVIWWVGYVDEHGGGSSSSMPARFVHVAFDRWVEQQKTETFLLDGDASTEAPSAAATPDGGWPGQTDLALVRFTGSGEEVEPLEGVTLLQQRPHPDLPASWARPRDRSVVAEVGRDGSRYYVLARRTADLERPQYIAVEAGPRVGATLDAFLEFARARYAEGGGGLL